MTRGHREPNRYSTRSSPRAVAHLIRLGHRPEFSLRKDRCIGIDEVPAAGVHSARRDHAATLLNSPRATELSVYVVRAFVELRGILVSNRELAAQVHRLERKVSTHERNIAELVDSMGQLLATPAPRPSARSGSCRWKKRGARPQVRSQVKRRLADTPAALRLNFRVRPNILVVVSKKKSPARWKSKVRQNLRSPFLQVMSM